MIESMDAPEVACSEEHRLRLVIEEEAILARVQDIGKALSERHAGRSPVVVGVLDGAFMLAADLVRAISMPCEVTFWKVSSYGAGRESSGVVREVVRPEVSLSGRHVIVVEDIVDSGRTLAYLVNAIQEAGAASVTTVTLLHKPATAPGSLCPDYVGFSVGSDFLVGYGLDYRGKWRHLRSLYALD